MKIKFNKLNLNYFLFVIGFLILPFSCWKKHDIKVAVIFKNKINNDSILQTIQIESKSVIKKIEDLKDFIPDNFSILDSMSGNLNLDNYPDLIVVLKENNEDTMYSNVDHPIKRPLLIIVGQNNETYKLAAQNFNTVYCNTCGGMMGDPYVGIKITDGFFSVEHYGGSAWRWERNITYKYSELENEWYLFADVIKSFHALNPEKIDSVIKTSNDFGKISFKEFDIYEN
jgi:hypothetical protein